jgi:hypothetical protein
MTSPSPVVCPRCRSNTAAVRATSPIAGVWTVFGCNTCFYTWRSTEPEENRDPEKYPAIFRLNPADVESFPIVPTIQQKR